MFGRLRAGAKFFTIGVILGLLFAPESGQEFRDQLKSRVTGKFRGSQPAQ
jgi:gas vesicle protein